MELMGQTGLTVTDAGVSVDALPHSSGHGPARSRRPVENRS